MTERPDAKSWFVGLLLAGLGAGVIAAPFIAGLHAMWVALAVTFGAALLAGAFGVLSASKSAEAAIFRRGG